METQLAQNIEKYLMLQNMFSSLNITSEDEKKQILINNFFRVRRPDIESDSDEDIVDQESCSHSETFPDRFTRANVCILCHAFVNYEPEAPYALGSVISEDRGEKGTVEYISQKIVEAPSQSDDKIIEKIELINEIYPDTDMDLKVIIDKYREYKTFFRGKDVKDNAILYVAIEPHMERLSTTVTAKILKRKLGINDNKISRVKGPLGLF